MINFPNWLAGMAISLLLLGCSASEQSLATQGDWYQIGYRDGIAGHQQRSYQALHKLGAVQLADYDEGYDDGVTQYCNPDFAYQIGLSGQYYDGVCAGTPAGNRFRMEWQRGWDQYTSH
ncbi:lipoprotein [Vibrio ruber DSM 16370]|uniref:Lipoprotein n=2 Tax=Vibrio ruber TaxID=184755 RepID=A0A1R4LB85_VIBR1|nr:lipoprotein [Vibrio ruber DSM 16370]